MRELYFDTEDVEEEKEVSDESAPQSSQFNHAQFMSQMKSQLKTNFSSIKNWTSLQCCLALHSDQQDVLINELSERFEFE